MTLPRRPKSALAVRWGKNIRLQRQARLLDGRSMSQVELAHAVGVTQGAVTQWERGESAPSIENQVAIAIALSVDARLLFPYPEAVSA